MTVPEHAEAPGGGPPVSRRLGLVLGVAAAASLGGAALAWWRFSPATADAQVVDQWWASRFDRLDGTPVAMSSLRGRPLLLNFWATWCPPCVQELPRLSAFYTRHQAEGWQVLGLAIDQAASVRGFVQRTPLAFPVVLGDAAGLSLVRGLGNPGGGLPFSVLFDAKGIIVQRKIGELSETDLQQWRSSI